MGLEKDEALREIYNLILNSGTRDWERSLLIDTKDALETGGNTNDQLGKLEAELRPLASRNNLTPDVADFYLEITGEPTRGKKVEFPEYNEGDLKYQERAVFAGGCFFCMVEPFETRPGIVSVLSGYTGGHINHPNYDQVSGGYSGHVEAVEIIFDIRIVSYKELVELYWQITDPTDAFGQFQDRGEQYRPIIFVQNEEQRQIAEKSKQELIASGQYKQPIVTEIRDAGIFWSAENYHQEFYKKQQKRYKRMKRSREQFLLYQRLTGKIRGNHKRKN